MNTLFKKTLQIFALSVFLLAFVSTTSAGEVTNSIQVKSSTGGNSASGGTVVEGQSSAHVKIKTIVNGEVVTDIDESVHSENGEDVSIEKEITNLINENVKHIEIGGSAKEDGEEMVLEEHEVVEIIEDDVYEVEEVLGASALQVSDVENELGEMATSATTTTDEESSSTFGGFIKSIINYVFSIFSN